MKLTTHAILTAAFLSSGVFAASDVAITEQDIEAILQRYEQETAQFAEADADGVFFRSLPPVPADVAAKWGGSTRDRFFEGSSGARFTLEDMYVRTLGYSSQIDVFSDLPLIRETGLPEAQGAFDTRLSLLGSYERRNEPVGDVLTTGGPSRFKQNEWLLDIGLSKKVITGGEVRLAQRFGNTGNNSTFFIPDAQATSELVLSFEQPLLRGGGLAYNRAPMEIAKLDSEAAMSEFIRQSEAHLLEVNRAYWTLYLSRALLEEWRNLVGESNTLVAELESRKDIDAMRSQLLRARAAAADRRTEIVRAELAVKNAEDRLAALVNDPAFGRVSQMEMIPVDRPRITQVRADMQGAVTEALRERSEIRQAFLQLRAAALRVTMSRNELRPQLNLVFEGSLNGLRGSKNLFNATGNEFTKGGPSVFAGFTFEMPLENKTARARYERRRLEIRQQLNQVKTTIETVLLEAKVSAREVRAAYRDMQGKYQSVAAADQELLNLTERRKVDAGAGENNGNYTSFYIENLIDSQDRRTLARVNFLESVVVYNVSLANLERAKGTLLRYEDIEVVRSEEDGLPRLRLRKVAGGKTVIDYKSAQ